MKIVEVQNTDITKNPHGIDARKIYDTEFAQAVHILLKHGESLKRHATPVDVFFYMLEGEGVIEIGAEKKHVGSDTLIDSPARIPHYWYNESEEILRVLVVKVPRPTESTRML